MALVAVLIAVLVAADLVLAVKLVATRSTNPPAASSSQTAEGGHPCNHGSYVSKAAHAKKGGKSVSGVAQSNAGKNGSCPSPSAEPKESGD